MHLVCYYPYYSCLCTFWPFHPYLLLQFIDSCFLYITCLCLYSLSSMATYWVWVVWSSIGMRYEDYMYKSPGVVYRRNKNLRAPQPSMSLARSQIADSVDRQWVWDICAPGVAELNECSYLKKGTLAGAVIVSVLNVVIGPSEAPVWQYGLSQLKSVLSSYLQGRRTALSTWL